MATKRMVCLFLLILLIGSPSTMGSSPPNAEIILEGDSGARPPDNRDIFKPFLQQYTTQKQINNTHPVADLMLLEILQQELNVIIANFKNLTSQLNNKLAISECEQDVFTLLLGIYGKQPWALSFLDAFGKPGSGIGAGNLKWPGSYSLCTGIKVNNDDANFSGQYCWLNAKINSSKVQDVPYVPPLATALCVPSTCSENSTFQFLESISGGLKKYLQLTSVTCVKPSVGEYKNDPKAIMSLVIISLFLVLILIGTIADVAHRRWANATLVLVKEPPEGYHEDKFGMSSEDKPSMNSVNNDNISSGSQVDLISYSKRADEVQVISPKKEWLGKVLESFSVYSNGLKIFGVKQEKGQLPCLHGIRFLSMCWVILGHTILTAAQFLENPADALPVLREFYFQPVMQAPFSVDSFFVLSGLLVTYLYLKEASKKEGNFTWKNWVQFYVHRYYRLTPTYMLVVFIFWVSLFKYYSNGPFWPAGGISMGTCEKSWWKNMLYINNFQDITTMCMPHSWYLATDMQFYIISPLFLFFLTKKTFIAAGLGSLFLLGSWITTGILASEHKLSVIINPEEISAHGLADPTLGFNVVYDKPYCRIGPYLIGMACGWLLHKTKSRARMHWALSLVGWCIAIACLTLPVFGLYKANPTLQMSAFYKSTTRSVWAIGISWIIFACCNGYGGIVNKILSWPVWMPFSRLTYCAYLIHLVVIDAVYLSMESLRHFSILNMIYDFFGHLIFSYMVAIAVSLMFEAPFLSLEKQLLNRKR